MTEFTPEFVAQVFGRTPAEPGAGDLEAPPPTAPVIPGQERSPYTGKNPDPNTNFLDQLFDRIA